MKAKFFGQTVTVCKLEDDQDLITTGGYDRKYAKLSNLEIIKTALHSTEMIQLGIGTFQCFR